MSTAHLSPALSTRSRRRTLDSLEADKENENISKSGNGISPRRKALTPLVRGRNSESEDFFNSPAAKRARMSLGGNRRVSFAATANVRFYVKDADWSSPDEKTPHKNRNVDLVGTPTAKHSATSPEGQEILDDLVQQATPTPISPHSRTPHFFDMDEDGAMEDMPQPGRLSMDDPDMPVQNLSAAMDESADEKSRGGADNMATGSLGNVSLAVSEGNSSVSMNVSSTTNVTHNTSVSEEEEDDGMEFTRNYSKILSTSVASDVDPDASTEEEQEDTIRSTLSGLGENGEDLEVTLSTNTSKDSSPNGSAEEVEDTTSMEMTVNYSKILANNAAAPTAVEEDKENAGFENEDTTSMEMTRNYSKILATAGQDVVDENEETTSMEMTKNYSKILADNTNAPVEEEQEEVPEETTSMEMTVNYSKILAKNGATVPTEEEGVQEADINEDTTSMEMTKNYSKILSAANNSEEAEEGIDSDESMEMTGQLSTSQLISQSPLVKHAVPPVDESMEEEEAESVPITTATPQRDLNTSTATTTPATGAFARIMTMGSASAKAAVASAMTPRHMTPSQQRMSVGANTPATGAFDRIVSAFNSSAKKPVENAQFVQPTDTSIAGTAVTPASVRRHRAHRNSLVQLSASAKKAGITPASVRASIGGMIGNAPLLPQSGNTGDSPSDGEETHNMNMQEAVAGVMGSFASILGQYGTTLNSAAKKPPTGPPGSTAKHAASKTSTTTAVSPTADGGAFGRIVREFGTPSSTARRRRSSVSKFTVTDDMLAEVPDLNASNVSIHSTAGSLPDMLAQMDADADEDDAMETEEAAFTMNLSGDGVEAVSSKDFLYNMGVRFLDDLSTNRRTTFCPPPRNANNDESWVEQMKLAHLALPEIKILEWACSQLMDITKGAKANVGEMSEYLSQNNPTMFIASQKANDEQMTVLQQHAKKLKFMSRLEAKKAWYEWRNKIEMHCNQKLQNDVTILTADAQRMVAGVQSLKEAMFWLEMYEKNSAASEEVGAEVAQQRDVLASRQDLIIKQEANIVALTQRKEDLSELKKQLAKERSQLSQEQQALMCDGTVTTMSVEEHHALNTLNAEIGAAQSMSTILQQISGWTFAGVGDNGATATMTFANKYNVTFTVVNGQLAQPKISFAFEPSDFVKNVIESGRFDDIFADYQPGVTSVSDLLDSVAFRLGRFESAFTEIISLSQRFDVAFEDTNAIFTFFSVQHNAQFKAAFPVHIGFPYGRVQFAMTNVIGQMDEGVVRQAVEGVSSGFGRYARIVNAILAIC